MTVSASTPEPSSATRLETPASQGRLRFSAVATGVICDIAATFTLVSVAASLVGFVLGSRGVPPDAIWTRMESIMAGSPWRVATLAIGSAGTILGGYVAARSGRPATMKHALATGLCSLALGAVLGATGAHDGAPLWHIVGGYLVVVPAALLGGSWARCDA
jgi:hypothetical protein